MLVRRSGLIAYTYDEACIYLQLPVKQTVRQPVVLGVVSGTGKMKKKTYPKVKAADIRLALD
jgi:hypothetical protein